ncbi:MAG: DUF58 domain-containing protein [Terriglobia bacterium]|jgi:uncharacterized protein (DUF58 family)
MGKSSRTLPLLGKLVRTFQDRLTSRGRYLFCAVLLLGAAGLDTRRTQVFTLFAVAAALFLVSSAWGLLLRPRVRLECQLPRHVTAKQPVPVRARIVPLSKPLLPDLQCSFLVPANGNRPISFHPHKIFTEVDARQPTEVVVELQPQRRGRYQIPGPVVRAADPLRLVLTREVAAPDQTVVVYPRFYSMEEFLVPAGRRYQPGGIPLASNTADAIEFVGTREYREGDPLKNIHWRSWARRGKPVVKEYQEEYFARIALILDTFVPGHSTPRDAQAFEAAISVVASIADFFSRSEYIVDILAAGPDIYEVSAGRSLAYLENILDVLACLEPCPQPPFQGITPALFEKLGQITTVVAVLLDWDAPREAFLRRVKSLGTAVRVLMVRGGSTSSPWQQVGPELGDFTLLSPDDVERALSVQGGANRPTAPPSTEAFSEMR